MQQLNLFDFVSAPQTTFQVHDKVKVLLVSEAENSEIYYYRKHYFSHVIGKTGNVLAVKNNTVLVQIKNENLIFDSRELVWIA